jgi:cyclase
MLKKRLIAALALNNGVLFRTKLFRPDYRYTLNFVDLWSIDEIVALDVTRPGEGERKNFEAAIQRLAENCFVPLTVGGGVKSLDDVKRLFDIGADKIAVNTGALERPELITEITDKCGSQALVVSIDAISDGRVFSHCGFWKTRRYVEEWAREAEQRGAGEILLTSIERDGALQGYDLALVKRVVDAVRIPVIALGGCGNWKHAAEVLKIADGACTQNIYHFTEASIRGAKAYLDQHGVPVRVS